MSAVNIKELEKRKSLCLSAAQKLEQVSDRGDYLPLLSVAQRGVASLPVNDLTAGYAVSDT